jgi:shikimate 5-dehydrogenase
MREGLIRGPVCRAALGWRWRFDGHGKRCLLLGAGGAVAGIAFALGKHTAEKVTIIFLEPEPVQ